MSQDSSRAASTNTTAEQPQVGHGSEETLQQCTLTMEDFPVIRDPALKMPWVGRLEDYNGEL